MSIEASANEFGAVVLRISHRVWASVELLSPSEARRLADELVEAAAHAERTAGPMTGGQAVAAVTGGKPVPVPPIPEPRSR